MKFAPLGDAALVVTLGDTLSEATLVKVRSLTAALEHDAKLGIVDVVPAYGTVTVHYDLALAVTPTEPAYARMCRLVAGRIQQVEHSWPDLLQQKLNPNGSAAAAAIEVPVCYAAALAPDLTDVAARCAMTPAAVAELHRSVTYTVQAIGFAPGFPYLGGLPEKLHVPRRATPRVAVPAGSVGIGGSQTGIYPVVTPGGWHLIGRTPVALFRPDRDKPALLRVGDHVVFRAITEEEFAAWR